MKKITSIFILICLLFTPALTSSASAHDYDYVYTDVNIITPDSFEDIFSETEADRASFTYEMATLNSSRAVVAMEIELKVGSDYYTTIVSGDIPAYTLPSGDTLYEGPISGTMTVSEDEYRVTAGFTKLESTGGVLVSVTMQGDSTMVAFSFGENLIQGEVLDFFIEKAGSGQPNNTAGSNVIGNLDSDEFGNNPGDTASPMVIDPPGFFPIINPGDGDGYDPIGTAWIKDVQYDYVDNSYCSLESRVYWSSQSCEFIVSLLTRYNRIEEYVDDLDSITFSYALDSFRVSLDVSDENATNSVMIVGEDIPNNLGDYIDGPTLTGRDLVFFYIFSNIFSKFGLLSDTIIPILEGLSGDFILDYDNDSFHKGYTIEIAPLSSGDPANLDDFKNGLLFGFILGKTNPNGSLGNINCSVNVSITYSYMAIGTENNPFITSTYYINGSTNHSVTINMQ